MPKAAALPDKGNHSPGSGAIIKDKGWINSMEKLLNADIEKQLREIFADLKQPVTVLLFTSQEECPYCDQTRQLVDEVTALDDRLELRVLDIDENADLAAQYKIDKVPALALMGKDGDTLIDYGIRFFGIPSGHEFTSLVHDLVLTSTRESGLTEKTRAFLAGLDKPVHLQVFVTPTCPYCPSAVVLAHRMALESPFVTADMVEAMEFPSCPSDLMSAACRTLLSTTEQLS